MGGEERLLSDISTHGYEYHQICVCNNKIMDSQIQIYYTRLATRPVRIFFASPNLKLPTIICREMLTDAPGRWLSMLKRKLYNS